MSTNIKKKPVPNSEPFEALGQTWFLAPIGPGNREELASRVRVQARRLLYADKPHLEPDHYRAEEKQLRADIAAGVYSWGPPRDKGGTGMGSAVLAAFQEDAGKVLLTQILLEPAHGVMGIDQISSLIEDSPEAWIAAFRAALGMPAALEEEEQKPEPADPNPPTPKTGTATVTPSLPSASS